LIWRSNRAPTGSLSFTQRPADVAEAHALIDGHAGVVCKLAKPSAVEALEVTALPSDAVTVARGDLGAELPAERVPAIQERVIRICSRHGRPVIVATQMIESTGDSPLPTGVGRVVDRGRRDDECGHSIVLRKRQPDLRVGLNRRIVSGFSAALARPPSRRRACRPKRCARPSWRTCAARRRRRRWLASGC
jgi:hypothetical protein